MLRKRNSKLTNDFTIMLAMPRLQPKQIPEIHAKLNPILWL